MSNNFAIVAKGIKKSYGKHDVLKGIDLNVEHGSITALLGPNGAGKTTMVHILSTLIPIDKGNALVNGFDVTNQGQDVRASIGLTGQYAAVDEDSTGEQNLLMIGRLYRLNRKDIKRRTVELLEQFDLTAAAYRDVKTYSGGMRRRLDLAVSLIASPPVIFLDEPTTGLDPRSRLSMWKAIRTLVEGGTTILLTTQYLEEADQLADKIAVLDDGRIIASGSPEELKRQVGSDQLKITISEKSDFQKAQRAVKGMGFSVDPQQRCFYCSTDDGVSRLRNALDSLEKVNTEIETVSLQKPTLDDVFLKLTGRQVTKSVGKETK